VAQDPIRKFARELSKRYRVTKGSSFRLKHFDPEDTGMLTDADKPRAQQALQAGKEALAQLQAKLFAHDRWSVLLIFQAMDAAGKDGAIKHVMSGIDPQGCQVYSFKAPSPEELDHDFLWRCWRALPERGRIGIFNRSYYEEVLVVRVHPEFLAAQKLPEEVVGKDLWKGRYEDIRAMERHLVRSGTIVLKFFLYMSKEEQRKQFLERIDDPAKNWKFSANDVKERQHWDAYMDAYQAMIRATATPDAPWYVVPADNKWYTRIVVAAAIVDALASLDLRFPKLDEVKQDELAAARASLLDERS
jgi:PPK2 family polyphosphate:nucleotide phosphotransferase